MQAYTPEQAALLTAPALEVSAGLELLAQNLTVVADISDDLAGGKVSWNGYADVHRTCDLSISRALQWGNVLVRPYMIVGGARWNVGTFALTTPERKIGETPETYDVQGLDRVYLLQRQVGMDYQAPAGTTYRQALLDAFTAAGLSGVQIDGSAADDTLPRDKDWPLVGEDQSDPDQVDTPVTWLRVVNDLLQQINFRAVWCDADGVYRCAAYQAPDRRAPEFDFTADDELKTVLSQDRSTLVDVWKAPNRWAFRWTNRPEGSPPPVEGAGVYTVDLSDAVNGDWLGRTLVWNDVVDYEAASQAKLVELGDAKVATDRRVARAYKTGTSPLPIASHFDVVSVSDAAAGLSSNAQATSWEMPLDGSDMSWTLQLLGGGLP